MYISANSDFQCPVYRGLIRRPKRPGKTDPLTLKTNTSTPVQHAIKETVCVLTCGTIGTNYYQVIFMFIEFLKKAEQTCCN